MKLKIYSIYDTVACVFNKPFTDINDASAIRTFKTACQEQEHANDFELHSLATYSDYDGIITPEKSPIRLITGREVKAILAKENPVTELKAAGAM